MTKVLLQGLHSSEDVSLKSCAVKSLLYFVEFLFSMVDYFSHEYFILCFSPEFALSPSYFSHSVLSFSSCCPCQALYAQ